MPDILQNMKNENITIVVVSDNHFAMMLGALIQSLITHHKTDKLIDLYIVDDSITAKNKSRLINSFEPGKLNVTWIKLSNILKDARIPKDRSSFPLNVYARLLMPHFLPGDLKKVIYMDVDMIACKDISDLWNINLLDYPIAAVRDRSDRIGNEWGGIANYKELGLDPNIPYYNAGLFLVNLEIWRKESIPEKIISCIATNLKHAGFPDQYGLNVILSGRILQIDFRWNCYSISDEKEPWIIHFIGNKPIYKSYDGNKEYAKEFFKYLRMSPWKDFKPYFPLLQLVNKGINKIKKKLSVW